MRSLESDIVVIGGGGAGLSAAAAASSNGATVTVLDENPGFGGQIWRSDPGSKAVPKLSALLEQLERNRVNLIPAAGVYDVSGHGSLFADTADGAFEIRYRKLVIATGARERFIPFPGWTLPNVYGAGGIQALVKGGLEVKGKRVVVAGTGPLLHAVSGFLEKRGAIVVAVADQARLRSLAGFAIRLAFYPSKLREALSLSLTGGLLKIKANSYVEKAEGAGKLEAVIVRQGSGIKRYECDLLAFGFHLVPNLEVPLLLGCEAKDGAIEVDEYQMTSVPGIYAAGESTGIGGIELSTIEGEIAGHAASENQNAARRLFSARRRYRLFAKLLNTSFCLRPELKLLPNDETIVCRCEDVPFGRLKKFSSWRDAKLQTRCGMGPCQARICGSAAEFLFDWKTGGPRPPLFPVRLDRISLEDEKE